MAAAHTHDGAAHTPDELLDAVNRAMRRLAIEGSLREVVEANLERIRVDPAHQRRSA